jgi:hypothetical protein
MATREHLTRQEIVRHIRSSPLGEFFVFWNNIQQSEVEEFRRVVACATTERPIQSFLQRVPVLLARHLRGGHGRWVVPQQRLGAEHVTDFLLSDAHSFGRDWYAVELESPKAKMFTKSGDPSATLRHAIRQIQDWRAWLKMNLNYATNLPSASGLWLEGIHSELPGLIIMGRRSETSDATREQRRRISIENRIEVHSYDWLIEAASGDVDWFGTVLGQLQREKELMAASLGSSGG